MVVPLRYLFAVRPFGPRTVALWLALQLCFSSPLKASVDNGISINDPFGLSLSKPRTFLIQFSKDER